MEIDRNILNIYKKYKIMSNLQLHMLRVASVASMIFDNWTGEEVTDKEKLITAALLHDMGNIIKFRLNYFPESLEPEGLDYWQDVQNEYFEKYGRDEHKATVSILRELSINEEIVTLVESMNFGLLCKHKEKTNPIELRILHYADLRVSPYGITSYEERMADVEKRYADIPHDEFNKIEKRTRTELLACGKDIERQIFANCKIKPEDINDESTKDIIEELKNFVVR